MTGEGRIAPAVYHDVVDDVWMVSGLAQARRVLKDRPRSSMARYFSTATKRAARRHPRSSRGVPG